MDVRIERIRTDWYGFFLKNNQSVPIGANPFNPYIHPIAKSPT
jgi:hypothetical protein